MTKNETVIEIIKQMREAIKEARSLCQWAAATQLSEDLGEFVRDIDVNFDLDSEDE